MSSGLDPKSGSGVQEERRLQWATALAAAAYLVLAARLFHLQIIRGADMWRLAEQNRTQVVPLAAPRGRILDRHGEVLLDNAPRFSLFYAETPGPRDEPQQVEDKLVGLFPDKGVLIRKRFAEARQSGKMTRLLAGIPRDKALGLIERRVTLPGVQVVVEPQRWARYGPLAGHVLGTVDEVSARELKDDKEGRWRAGQFVGRMGVERMYDQLLRGTDGGLQFEIDARGRHIQVMRRIPAAPGNDVVLTLDRSLQAAAERGLDATNTGRGAVVAVDPRNGEVLALVSHPGFDPSGDMADLLDDPDLPLFNRALQGVYPPGSVFKAVTALAALRDGWNPDKVIFCTGVFKLGNREFKCWKRHNALAFMDAMAWSCDVYHYYMGLQEGVDALEALGRQLGLGERTGIDLPSESAGVIPSPAWKLKTQKQGWFDGDTVNMSIGQGFTAITPLQAAMMVAAIANEGTLWRPRVVDRAVSPDGKEIYKSVPQARRQVQLPARTWALVKRSMEEVVRRGTGGGAYRPDLVIGGKTGTAQNPHGEDHSWFAAYAGLPGEAPNLVVVGFVENGGHGSDAALPVVREVLKEAFPLPQPRTPSPAPAPLRLAPPPPHG